MRPRLDKPDEPPAVEHGEDVRRRIGQAACLLLLLALAVVLLRTAWVSDDAFITLRTVDNFVHGYGLRWNPAERVQSFTHPLWLFLVSAAYTLTGEAYYTITTLAIVTSLAAALLLVRGFRDDPGAAAVGLTVWILSKALVDYSTSGLENPLTHLLLVAFLLLLPEAAPGPRRLVALAVLSGLAVLSRPDAILLFAPGLVFALVRHGRWSGLAHACAGFSPVLVWGAFSIFYYGLPCPNTALAKLNTAVDGAALAQQGVRYLINSLRNDPLTLTVTVVALVAALSRGSWRERSIATGIVLYLAYVVRIGGDFMSGRFLSPVVLASAILIGQLAFFRAPRVRLALAAGVLLLGLLAPFPPPFAGSDFGVGGGNLVDASGIADERRFYFGDMGLLNGSPDWRRPSAVSTRRGRELERAGAKLAAEGAVGLLGFEAGPGVHIVDYHALCDPLLARLPAVVDDPLYRAFFIEQVHRPPEVGWRIGHFLRALPRGYLATLATGENRIEDPAIADLWDRLSLVTRGPLWSRERLAEIVRINLGGAPSAPRPTPGFEWFDWREVLAVDPGSAEAHYQLGRWLVFRGMYAEALTSLLRAVEIDPRHALALNEAAKTSILFGRYEEAAELSRRAQALDPDDPSPYVNMGDVLRHQGRFREAIELLRQAVERDPVLAAPMYSNIGLCHLSLGEHADAVAWLQRSMDVNPEIAATSYSLGVALTHAGDAQEGLRMFERALDQDPGYSAAALDAAAIHMRAGAPRSAVETLDRFLAHNPDDALVLFRQGELLVAVGNVDGALDRWRAAARLGYEPARRALAEHGASW